mgnify:CR=1 FL=1
MLKCVICGRELPYQQMKCKVRVVGLKAIVDNYCPNCVLYMQDQNIKLPKVPVSNKKTEKTVEEQPEKCSVCGGIFPSQEIRIRVNVAGIRAYVEHFCLSCYSELKEHEAQQNEKSDIKITT